MNILALLIVVGLCWLAMMWLGDRFHGSAHHIHQDDVEPVDRLGDLDTLNADEPGAGDGNCPECRGLGARTERGRLATCPLCEGTGVSA